MRSTKLEDEGRMKMLKTRLKTVFAICLIMGLVGISFAGETLEIITDERLPNGYKIIKTKEGKYAFYDEKRKARSIAEWDSKDCVIAFSVGYAFGYSSRPN